MSSKYIKSPIHYAGSKYRLLNRVIPLFPEKIDSFVDLFGGAFNVGINVNANTIYYNDINSYLANMFMTWSKWDLEYINWAIDEIIEKHHLSPTDKEAFLTFRKEWNESPDRHTKLNELFVLMCYSFNGQLRFNAQHEFNSSFGYEANTMNPNIRKNLNEFVNVLHEKECIFLSQDFRQLSIKPNMFVYVDSPYSLGCGVYQDGKRGFSGWSSKDDEDLLQLLGIWNHQGVKWAVSNVFANKGQTNEQLIEWSKNYNVYHLAMNYSNANYHRKNVGSTDEVLITNY